METTKSPYSKSTFLNLNFHSLTTVQGRISKLFLITFLFIFLVNNVAAQTVLLDEDFENCTNNTSGNCKFINCSPWNITHGSPHVESNSIDLELYLWSSLYDTLPLIGEGIFTEVNFKKGRNYVIELNYAIYSTSTSIAVVAANNLQIYGTPGSPDGPDCGSQVPTVAVNDTLSIGSISRSTFSNVFGHRRICFNPSKNYDYIWFYCKEVDYDPRFQDVRLDNIKITDITVNAGEDVTICENDPITLEVSGFDLANVENISWEPATSIECVNPNQVPKCTEVSITPTASTIVTLEVEYTNGCVAYDTVEVDVQNCCRSNIDSFSKRFEILGNGFPGHVETLIKDVGITHDSGYLFLLEDRWDTPNPFHSSGTYLLRYDKLGSLMWEKKFYPKQFTPSDFVPEKVIEITDENGDYGIVIAGMEHGQFEYPFSKGHWLLIKTDELGNIGWTKRSDFGNTIGYSAYSAGSNTTVKGLLQSTNGDLILSGQILLDNRMTCIVAMRLNSAGTVLNRKAYQLTSPHHEAEIRISGMIETPDLGYVISGIYRCQTSSGTSCLYGSPFILRIDAQLSPLYHNLYQPPIQDIGSFAQNVLDNPPTLTSSGEIIITSYYKDPSLQPYELVFFVDEKTGNIIKTWDATSTYHIGQFIENAPGEYHFGGRIVNNPTKDVFGTVDNTATVLDFNRSYQNTGLHQIKKTGDEGYILIGNRGVNKTTHDLKKECKNTESINFTQRDGLQATEIPFIVEDIGSLAEVDALSAPLYGCEYCNCDGEVQNCFSSYCNNNYDQYLDFEIVQLDDCRYRFTNTSGIPSPLTTLGQIWRFTGSEGSTILYDDQSQAIFELDPEQPNEICLFVQIYDQTTGMSCWAQKCWQVVCTPRPQCENEAIPEPIFNIYFYPTNPEEDSCSYMFEDVTPVPGAGYSVISRIWEYSDGTKTVEDPINQSTVHTFSKNGTHEVCLILLFSNGSDTCWKKWCTIVGGCDTIFGAEPSILGIDRNETKNVEKSVVLYPNPTQGAQNLKLDIIWQNDIRELKLQIFDLVGSKLNDYKIKLNNDFKTITRYELPINNLSPGFYVLRFSDGEHTLSSQFLVE